MGGLWPVPGVGHVRARNGDLEVVRRGHQKDLPRRCGAESALARREWPELTRQAAHRLAGRTPDTGPLPFQKRSSLPYCNLSRQCQIAALTTPMRQRAQFMRWPYAVEAPSYRRPSVAASDSPAGTAGWPEVRARGAGATAPVAEAVRAFGLHAAVGVPVSVGGRLWGVLVADPCAGPLPAGTELAATAIANAEAQAALTASRARIVATADATRRRIEHNLHDGCPSRSRPPPTTPSPRRAAHRGGRQ